MESASLRRREPGAGVPSRLVAIPAATWAKAALMALTAAALAGYVVCPTYPNYDSIYSLVWGREILHGHLPSFDAYRAPTEHPLWLAASVVLDLVFGDHADRALLLLTLLSFVALT